MPEDVTPSERNSSEAAAPEPQFGSLLSQITSDLEADIIWYSGPIDDDFVADFLDHLEGARFRPNLALILTTYGGSADAAFRMCRCIKHNYQNFYLLVPGYCKSAGTLIAIGADEIIMLPRGELGPLDVQLAKKDDLFGSSSGLDITDALNFISTKSFALFEEQFTTMISRSGGQITTKTAGEIATAITVGLMSPITQQLDPIRIGETQRAMNIAAEYGKLLGATPDALRKLIHGYPSHGFVIDFSEAKRADLFDSIREANSTEEAFFEEFTENVSEQFGANLLREPSGTRLVTVFLNAPPQSLPPPTNDQGTSNDTDADTAAPSPTESEQNGTTASPNAQDHPTGESIPVPATSELSSHTR